MKFGEKVKISKGILQRKKILQRKESMALVTHCLVTHGFCNRYHQTSPSLDLDKRQNQDFSPLLHLSRSAAVVVMGGINKGKTLFLLLKSQLKEEMHANAWWELVGKRRTQQLVSHSTRKMGGQERGCTQRSAAKPGLQIHVPWL